MKDEKEVVIELQVVDGKATTTSRQVAEMFNKEHKDVLKIIKNLVEQLDFNQRNFAPVDYRDLKGEMRPMYNIDRDGFTLLAMGFNGQEALNFKMKYIQAFNAMEQELLKQKSLSIPKTYSQALLEAGRLAEENEKKQLLIEKQNEQLVIAQPKTEFFDLVTKNDKEVDFATVAKILKKCGRNKLMEQLRKAKILNDKNIPYQQYVEAGYFKVVESSSSDKNGRIRIHLTTVVYNKGIDFICKKLGYIKNTNITKLNSFFD